METWPLLLVNCVSRIRTHRKDVWPHAVRCNKASPAVHYDGYSRDSGIPDMVQHADQGGGVLWDSVVRPTSEEVVIQGAGLCWVMCLYMERITTF